jgi:hypothetical protein
MCVTRGTSPFIMKAGASPIPYIERWVLEWHISISYPPYNTCSHLEQNSGGAQSCPVLAISFPFLMVSLKFLWWWSIILVRVSPLLVSMSPFTMKWEMRPWYTHLPYEKKGDARTRGASRIMSPWPKISGPTLSLTTHSNFSLPPSALTLDTILPSPHVVIDPGPRARHCLVPSLRACYHLNLGLRARHLHPLPHAIDTVAPPSSTSTLPPSERVAAVLFLRVRHHRPLPRSTPP